MAPSFVTHPMTKNRDSGALAKLDLSNNNWEDNKSPDFIRPIATMLKTNTSLKELNLAGNNLNAEAGRIFSEGLHDNGALASLDISNNNLVSDSPNIQGKHSHKEGDMVEYEGLQCPVTCAQFRHYFSYYRVSMLHGIVALANAIQDMGALSKLDISRNHIPDSEQAELRRICSAKSIDCQL